MRLIKIFCLSFALIFLSCASAKFEGSAAMTGRVCDSHGNPVPQYHISAGLGLETMTDASGIFVFKNLSSGNYHISGGGNGWCGTDMHFFFYNRKDILCIQVESLEENLPKIESFIRDGDFSSARDCLAKSKKYNEKNPLFLCYKKLIDYCESPSDKKKRAFLSVLDTL